MYEAQTVQLSQPRENLKQYFSKLAGLAVLLEVQSEIHIVPLENKECGCIRELNSDQRDNIFALFISSFVQNLVLEVKLLSQHVVLLESIVSVGS